MAFESGLQSFFERALHARLHEQLSHLRSMASRSLRVEPLVEGIFEKYAMDADRKATWTRRDDRGALREEE
jgi:hypothetical protein